MLGAADDQRQARDQRAARRRRRASRRCPRAGREAPRRAHRCSAPVSIRGRALVVGDAGARRRGASRHRRQQVPVDVVAVRRVDARREPDARVADLDLRRARQPAQLGEQRRWRCAARAGPGRPSCPRAAARAATAARARGRGCPATMTDRGAGGAARAASTRHHLAGDGERGRGRSSSSSSVSPSSTSRSACARPDASARRAPRVAAARRARAASRGAGRR